jgi:hypothetical protein
MVRRKWIKASELLRHESASFPIFIFCPKFESSRFLRNLAIYKVVQSPPGELSYLQSCTDTAGRISNLASFHLSLFSTSVYLLFPLLHHLHLFLPLFLVHPTILFLLLVFYRILLLRFSRRTERTEVGLLHVCLTWWKWQIDYKKPVK